MGQLCNSTGSAYIPKLRISEQKTDGTVPKESGGEKKGESSEQESEKTIVLDGGVIFSEKMKSGTIEEDSCTGLQFLCNRMAEYSVTVDTENNYKSTITFFSVQTSITPKFDLDGRLYFDIMVKADGRFDERGGISETDTDKIMKVRSDAENKVRALIEKAIEEVRNKCRSDVFGLEKSLRHHYPDYASKNKNNITEIILSAPCKVRVECDTFSLGLESY